MGCRSTKSVVDPRQPLRAADPADTRANSTAPRANSTAPALDQHSGQQFKPCPACGVYIEKLAGDDFMMCGCEARPAGGTYEKALAGGGCGHEFMWSTLEAVGCGKPGAPVNERQVNFGVYVAMPKVERAPKAAVQAVPPKAAAVAMPCDVKQCPACGMYIEKLDGDDNMMCGCEARPAGGTYEKALAGGGCGHEFKWSTLEAVGCGKPGAPANDRQVNFLSGGSVTLPAKGKVKAKAKAKHTARKPEVAAMALPANIKACPACGLYIEKDGGDDNMMCGCEARPAGGTYEKALLGGGCGHEFKWSTLEPVAGGKPGEPANERQVNFTISASSATGFPGYWSSDQEAHPRRSCVLACVDDAHLPVFDQLLNDTYVAKSTQDRVCPTGEHRKTPGGCPCVQLYPEDILAEMPPHVLGLPTGYRVQQVIRNQDMQMWAKYVNKREEIRNRRRGEVLRKFSPSLLTESLVKRHPQLFSAVDSDSNEAYLLHGTAVTSALDILQNDFRLSLAGVATGSMYGRGVYLCESSTKADEYGKDYASTDLEGVFALLVCRVVMGKFYYTAQRDETVESKVLRGTYDSTLGDRVKAAGTFREFVVYNSNQVYPEYLVIYHRVHARDKPEDIERRVRNKLELGF